MNWSMKCNSVIPSNVFYGTADASYCRFSRCILSTNIIPNAYKYMLFLYRNGSGETNEDDIQTTSNEAYEEMKHRMESGEAYEMAYVTAIASSPTKSDPTYTADLEGLYDAPSATSEPLPDVPASSETQEQDTGVYEAIPGDS